MDERKERCICCMEEKQPGAVCPRCGFSDENRSRAPYLNFGTVLQRRYLVGKVQSFNGEGVSYLAYDQTEGSKILLREFFPQTIAFRENDGVTVSVMAGGEETFQYARESFLSYTRKVAHCRDYPAVLPVFDIFTENGTAYAVYEWCTGGTLKEYIEKKGAPMSWNLAKALFLPLISSLKGLHAVGLGHYGIAPENLLIFSDGRMKLGGFCLEDIRREEQDFSPELFAGCAALEQYSSNESLAEYTDIYGLCACLFYALTMHLPQEATRRKYDSRLLIANSTLQQIPPFVVSALAGGLQVMPEKRIQTFEELYHQLVGGEVMSETVEPESIAKPSASSEKQPGKKKKERKQLPHFLLGAISFCCALTIFCLCGWLYLKNRYGDDLFNFGETSSDSVSSEWLTSSEEAASSEAGESGTASEDTSSVPEGFIAVPNLVGQTLSAAQSNTDFKVLLTNRDFSDTVKEGLIMSQSVEGYAQPGTVITVVVSKGTMMRVLPDVEGIPLDEAKSALLAAGFQIGIVTEEPSEEASGTVLRTTDPSLKAGISYEYGTTVDLIVAQEISSQSSESE
ncbi:MAG: PASTA domain-containing protein [Firmicutes bacterium]|nr:PASTA domain-containing protein [Bacillota bacterium]